MSNSTTNLTSDGKNVMTNSTNLEPTNLVSSSNTNHTILGNSMNHTTQNSNNLTNNKNSNSSANTTQRITLINAKNMPNSGNGGVSSTYLHQIKVGNNGGFQLGGNLGNMKVIPAGNLISPMALGSGVGTGGTGISNSSGGGNQAINQVVSQPVVVPEKPKYKPIDERYLGDPAADDVESWKKQVQQLL